MRKTKNTSYIALLIKLITSENDTYTLSASAFKSLKLKEQVKPGFVTN